VNPSSRVLSFSHRGERYRERSKSTRLRSRVGSLGITRLDHGGPNIGALDPASFVLSPRGYILGVGCHIPSVPFPKLLDCAHVDSVLPYPPYSTTLEDPECRPTPSRSRTAQQDPRRHILQWPDRSPLPIDPDTSLAPGSPTQKMATTPEPKPSTAQVILVTVGVAFLVVLYIACGVILCGLHGHESAWPVHAGRVNVFQTVWPRWGERTKQGTAESKRDKTYVAILLLFILFWPFFMMYTLAWAVVYWIWSALYICRRGRTPGKVTSFLKATLECEKAMPIPKMCRRAMGEAERRKKYWETIRARRQDARRREAGSDEDLELGLSPKGTPGCPAKALNNVDVEEEDILPRRGSNPVCDVDSLTNHQQEQPESQPLRGSEVRQPNPPDRRTRAKASHGLWTIPETDEVFDNIDLEDSRMAHVGPTKSSSPV